MSNSADVGDLENSLPSWVSEHLGEKSVMTDEVNQLPFLPYEESPLRDNSSDHRKDLDMSTYSPLEKEINVMTQGDLDCLRGAYSFPIGIQAKILEEGETILSTCPLEVVFMKFLSLPV